MPGLRQMTHGAFHAQRQPDDDRRRGAPHSQLNEDRLYADGERILRRLDLTAEQSADLAAFLRSVSAQ